MKQFRLEDTKTNEIIGFDRAENVLEIIRKYDLATKENAHIKVIQTN